MTKLSELLLQYIDYEKNIVSHSCAYERHYYHIKRLNEYLLVKKWSNYDITDIQLTDILDFLAKYKVSKIKSWPNSWKYPSHNSQYNLIVSCRMFFKYLALIWEKLSFNREQIPITKMEDITRPPMSKSDYELLLQAPKIYNDSDRQDIILRDQLLFEIPWETWLRRAEVMRCKFEDFHNNNRQFKILVKWGRYENVFFSENLQKKVLKYEELVREKYRGYENIEYLFFYMGQKDKGKPMTPKVAWIIFLNYVNKLKKSWLIPIDKKLCMHMERHSFAMKCVYSGLSQQATTALMRHKDPKITLRYYHMNDERLLSQYDNIK